METPPPAASQSETPAPGTEATPAPITITVTPELLAALGVATEGATAESVTDAITALCDKAKGADSLTAQIETLQKDLQAAQARELSAAEAAAAKELAAELADYDLDDASSAVLGTLPKDHRATMLAKMPKKAAPVEAAAAVPPKTEEKKATVPPPAPVHDPKGETKAAPTSDEKAKEAEKLIAEIRKEAGGKFAGYEAARAEARRRKPELFA